MGTWSLVLHLWPLFNVWLLVISSFDTSFKAFAYWDDPSIVYTYNRFSEIQDKCGHVLSSAAELEPDDNRGSNIKRELSFRNGDWEQESRGAPLMPFDDRQMGRNPAGSNSFLKLASFWIVDVDPVRRSENVVSVSGIMEIGITGHHPFSYRPGWSPKFRMEPGFSSLTILFEGVFVESEENVGEKLFCLLGTSVMPTTNQPNTSQSQEPTIADVYGYKSLDRGQPPLLQDDQILLVLKYSKTLSLTTGKITGVMESLHEKSNPKYFDRVHLSSHLDINSKYQFGAEELVSKACSPYPYQDSLVDDELGLYKDDDTICDTLQRLVSSGMFDIVPSWKSVSSNVDANKLGPFVLDGMAKDINGGNKSFRLYVQNLQCHQETDEHNNKTAIVSALFRMIQSREDGYRSASRTSLSGQTLSAEGMWRSSEGQLCMVACLGITGTTSEECKSRICLYFPLTFSITQRTTVFGTITGMADSNSNNHLWFEKEKRLDLLIESRYNWKPELVWSYNYSKIMQAKAFQIRSKPSELGTSLRKSLLEYPRLYDGSISSLSFLADQLSLFTSAVPCAFPKAQSQRTSVTIRVLSSGSLFGRYNPRKSGGYQEVEQSSDFSAERIETSGHLSITGEHFNSISLSFEGVYDSTVGIMYLIGCRDVRNILKNFKEMDLERGMDCQFEAKVKYPFKKMHWLKNPELRISIRSKRSKDDPLYLNPVSLKSDPIYDDQESANVIFRKTFEQILKVLMLMVAIACTRSQLRYISDVVDPTAYISRVMINISAVDYVNPLISSGDVFFKWKVFQSNGSKYNLQGYEMINVLDYIIKGLSLVALLLTFNLGKEVSESRTREIVQGRKQQSQLPDDKKVFFVTSVIIFIGFLVTQVVCSMMSLPEPFGYALDSHVGLLPDFFLLPQIVVNSFWHHKDKGKPLRKLYYMGLTSLRVLLHVYDYIRDPVPDNSFGVYLHYPYSNLDLDSKFRNIVAAVMVIVLALIVYKQQRTSDSQQLEEEMRQKLRRMKLASSLSCLRACFLN